MSDRSHPCKFQLKSIEPSTIEVTEDGKRIRKMKKVVQKKDENGNPMYEIKEVTTRKGCKCKGNETVETVEKKVPITEEIWIDAPLSDDASERMYTEPMIMCKLYGKVKSDFCKTCGTYKKGKK